MIPKSFECMGMKVTVEVGGLKHANEHGTYDHGDRVIAIDEKSNRQNKDSTFWHEFVHCVFDTLGYDEDSKDEQKVELIAQCLYQLQKTRKGEQ